MSFQNSRHLFVRSLSALFPLVLAALLAPPASVRCQTFRGGISGTVTDQSGAVVPSATVTALETATNSVLKIVTSSAGEFAFTNLPLGDYSITITAAGFSKEIVNKVTVTAGSSYVLPIKLGVASAAQTVEVTANALALDTVTDVQTSDIPEAAVQTLPNSGRDFTQMLSLNAGFAGYSTGGGALSSSVRSRPVRFVIATVATIGS